MDPNTTMRKIRRSKCRTEHPEPNPAPVAQRFLIAFRYADAPGLLFDGSVLGIVRVAVDPVMATVEEVSLVKSSFRSRHGSKLDAMMGAVIRRMQARAFSAIGGLKRGFGCLAWSAEDQLEAEVTEETR